MRLAEEISKALQLPPRYIRGVALKASYSYRTYQIPKRDGRLRTIEHPSRALKALQRWLLHSVVERWPVHSAAYAYRRGSSIAQHADVHASSRFLLRVDLKQFFPSLLESDISAFLATKPLGTADWNSEDESLFISLVCRHGHLTIGAPTSPGLSNALCFQMDQTLQRIAEGASATYTRYADDLFFSTRKPNILKDIPSVTSETLAKLDWPRNLQVNPTKTRHSSRKGRRQVTGIVLASDGRAVLGRSRKRYLRAQIHQFQTLDDSQRSRLRGLLSFAMSVEPRLLNELILKYGRDRVVEAWKGRS
jgi:RNA-directed DNA polymerase